MKKKLVRRSGQGVSHEPNDELRQLVEVMIAGGMLQKEVAAALSISIPTLMKHYREQLDNGAARANSRVIVNLYRQATKNDFRSFPAARLWANNRLGWTENQRHEVSGPDGGAIQTETKVSADESFARIVDALNLTAEKKAAGEGE